MRSEQDEIDHAQPMISKQTVHSSNPTQNTVRVSTVCRRKHSADNNSDSPSNWGIIGKMN